MYLYVEHDMYLLHNPFPHFNEMAAAQAVCSLKVQAGAWIPSIRVRRNLVFLSKIAAVQPQGQSKNLTEMAVNPSDSLPSYSIKCPKVNFSVLKSTGSCMHMHSGVTLVSVTPIFVL